MCRLLMAQKEKENIPECIGVQQGTNKLCNHLDRNPPQTEKRWPPQSDPGITGTMADGSQSAPNTSCIRAATGSARTEMSARTLKNRGGGGGCAFRTKRCRKPILASRVYCWITFPDKRQDVHVSKLLSTHAVYHQGTVRPTTPCPEPSRCGGEKSRV